MNWLTQNVNNFLELFYPSVCITCGERLISQESYICLNCWLDLPVTNFHQSDDNKVAQLFWGRVQIENATSYFSYKKGSRYQNLIHSIKYKGRKELGVETGKRLGYILIDSAQFKTADLVVPVPLHPKKQKKRGYNQSDCIATGIAESMNLPVSSCNLFRKVFTATQTRKNRFERFQNVDGIFGIKNPDEFVGKHIIIVDDVVTTGSTLEACAYEIQKIKETKISIATLAFADF